jgi:nitrate/nitrite transport system substrate-binding protein
MVNTKRDTSAEGPRLRHVGSNCICGIDHETPVSVDDAISTGIASGLLAGLFPDADFRRKFLKTVGTGTAFSAISSVLPLASLTAIAQESKAPLEKKKISVGFLPITCATPLIYAEQLGMFSRQGLDVSLQKIAGVNLIRDKMLNGELDVSQQVMPVALSMSLGIGSIKTPVKVMTILNQHGNSLVLAMKHKDNRNPKNWKGFKFAVPFEQSHQMLQLRYYLAANGLDPDKDVSYRIVPPSEYVSNLRVGSVDGFFGGEPGGQRAVFEGAGFIHLISSEIWPGHPCCSVTATELWIKSNPNTFLAAYRAIINASLHVADPANRAGMAKILALPQYLNQPEAVVDQVITGKYADGLGNIKTVPQRVDFQPFPHYSMAVWLMTQMRRWNMIKEDIDYKAIAQEVMLVTDAKRLLEERGVKVGPIGFRKEMIMGREFDSNKPNEYLKSLAAKA